MNNEGSHAGASVTLEYKKLQKVLVLDKRVFEPCHPKEVEQWSWKRLKNEKYLVHLQKTKAQWSIRKLSN
jgi:hypothetical protein